MVPYSMTLSDLSPGFQGHVIFCSRISEKTARLKDKVTIVQEETIPNIWNGTIFVNTTLKLLANFHEIWHITFTLEIANSMV